MDSATSQAQAGTDQAENVAHVSDTNQAVGTSASAALLNQSVRQQLRTVVPRPIPKAQIADTREFQIGQIKRRFASEVSDENERTTLAFQLQPSDPDFPFELDGLRCTLTVPRGYPSTGRPTLKVSNAEMERGYQINVERGFDSLVEQSPQKSLLSLMNELDKNLERFLTSEKAQTVKIVANTVKKLSPAPPVAEPEVVVKQVLPVSRTVAYSQNQRAEVHAKRESDIRQLEARLGRQPLFSKSTDGTSFNLPLQTPKPGRLPVPLQSLKDVTLLVPLLYNLEPCTIMIKGVRGDEAQNVERAFERRASQQSEQTLMAHVNYLAQNMHVMVHESHDTATEQSTQQGQLEAATTSATVSEADPKSSSQPMLASSEEDKPHIVIIPRPPEWDMIHGHSDEDDSSDSYDSEEEFSDDEDGGIAVPPEPESTNPELGVSLSFPLLELYGVAVLIMSSLSLTIKCDRCKTTIDVKNIRPQANSGFTKHESCSKCANIMSVGFRGNMMHTNNVRAGSLDLEGCTVVDLLPSTFIPNCTECSTDYPQPGVVAVRGDNTMVICRECHHKMSFKIPEVKFLRVSSAGVNRPDRPLPRKKVKENLGIVAGQELPRKGRCRHYSKSYRWFRFSCCQKVYACDRCHDEKEEHANEHANRMICGLCSREQIYRPEDCVHCHSSLVGKKGGGFWEGGKGTRDKNRMSRKDPRKYKRRGGGATVGGTGKGKGK